MRTYITKSRGSHYTVTVRDNGHRASRGKLDNIHVARLAIPELVAEVAAKRSASAA